MKWRGRRRSKNIEDRRSLPERAWSKLDPRKLWDWAKAKPVVLTKSISDAVTRFTRKE